MRLKHVAQFTAGGTPDTGNDAFWDNDRQGIPWVSIADMSGTSLVRATHKQLTKEGLAAKRLQLGASGTVLFAMYASVGAVSTLDAPAAWNQAILGITAQVGRADSRFIAYWLRHLAADLGAITRTSTQENLNADQVANFPFPTLGTAEQRRIADFLDDQVARIDNIIAARQQQMQQLAELEEQDLEKALWRASTPVQLRRLKTSVTTGPFGTVFAANDYVENGVPMVNPVHIRDGKITPERAHTVSAATAARLVRHQLAAGDIATGRKGDLGRSALVTVKESGWICGSDAIAIHVDQDKLDPTFLELVLHLPRVRAGLVAESGAATMPSLNEGMLLSLRVPGIGLAEQRARAVEAGRLRQDYFDMRSAMMAFNEHMTELKRSLITAAVSGEFEVSTADGSQVPVDRPPRVPAGTRSDAAEVPA